MHLEAMMGGDASFTVTDSDDSDDGEFLPEDFSTYQEEDSPGATGSTLSSMGAGFFKLGWVPYTFKIEKVL